MGETSPSGARIYLTCCTFVLCNEIENLRLPQKEVALTFAMALRSEFAGIDKVDWDKVGAAALRRWKPSGWVRVKELGWAYYEGRKHPQSRPDADQITQQQDRPQSTLSEIK